MPITVEQAETELRRRKAIEELARRKTERTVISKRIQAGETLSRRDLANLGVIQKTSAKDRKVIADTMRRRNIYAVGGMGGFDPGITKDTASYNYDFLADIKRVPKQIVTQFPGGIEEMAAKPGAMVEWMSERQSIGNILTKHIDIPGAGIVAEYLVRKFGPKKAIAYYDKKMAQHAEKGKKWSVWWQEQANKGWKAPNREVTEAKWGELPLAKGAAVISRAAPNYLAAIALSVLTKSPQTGLLFISATSGAGAYRRQRKAGTGKQMANAVATLTTAWEYGTEKIPFDYMLKPAKSGLLKKMLISGSLESAQEFVQGIGESFLEYFGYSAKDLESVPLAVREGMNHALDDWIDNIVAGAGLGILGAGMVGRAPREAIAAPEEPVAPITPEIEEVAFKRPLMTKEELVTFKREAQVRRILGKETPERMLTDEDVFEKLTGVDVILPDSLVDVEKYPIGENVLPEMEARRLLAMPAQRLLLAQGFTETGLAKMMPHQHERIADIVRETIIERFVSSKSWGAENVLITKKQYDEIIKRRKKGKLKGGRHAGGTIMFNPQEWLDMMKVGLYQFEAGLRSFSAWSNQMVKDFGETIKPSLAILWSEVNKSTISLVKPPEAVVAPEAELPKKGTVARKRLEAEKKAGEIPIQPPPPLDLTQEPPGEPTAEFGESFLKSVTRRAEVALKSGIVSLTPKSLLPLINETVTKLKTAVELSQKERAVIEKEKTAYQKQRAAETYEWFKSEEAKAMTPQDRMAATVRFYTGEQYGKQRWEPIDMSDEDMVKMHAYIEDFGLGIHDRRGTSEALARLIGGYYLTNHEIAWLADVFPEIAEVASKRRGARSRIMDLFMSFWGFPKAIKAAIDISILGRQAYPLLLSRPSLIPQGTWQSLKLFWRRHSAEYSKALTAEMRRHPAWKRAKKMGVAVIEPGELSEEFPTRWAKKIPGIARSERAFVDIGNLLRVAAHDIEETNYIEKGKPLSDEESSAAAKAINDLSGRAGIPKALSGISLLLSGVAWSPRLVLARFKAPFRMVGRHPAARNMAIRSFTRMAALSIILSLLAKWRHERDEDIDSDLHPLSTDFCRIKYKNQRVDTTAGYGPMIRTVARVALGMTKTGAGEITEKSRLETIKQWGRAKAAPGVGIARKIITKKDWLGRPAYRPPEGTIGEWMTELGISDASQIVAKEFYEELLPLPMVDVVDAAYIDGWLSGIVATPLAFGGIGTLTYEPWASTELRIEQNKMAQKAYGKQWDELGPKKQTLLQKRPSIIKKQLAADVESLYQRDEYEIDKIRYQIYRKMPVFVRKELDSIGVAISAPARKSGKWRMSDIRYDWYVERTTKLIKLAFEKEFRTASWRTKRLTYKQERVRKIMTDKKEKARKEVKRLSNVGRL